ncbi:MAG: universal stress protein [Sphingobium sp.]
MKTILLMVHDDMGQDARLQCALDLTRALDGHLVCLDLLRLPVLVDAYGGGPAQATVLFEERDREDANVAQVEDRLRDLDVSHEWIRAQGDFDHSLAQAARLADLVVMSSKDAPGLGDQGDLPGRVARATTAPVLVVPPGAHEMAVRGRALVGWDGSAPAADALRAAVPLLRLACSVEILTIGGGDGQAEADPQDAVRYLARHGCTATARVAEQVGSLSTHLHDAFASAAWGVMGSYGHGRLRERLFGGTTHTLLEETPVPLLISH